MIPSQYIETKKDNSKKKQTNLKTEREIRSYLRVRKEIDMKWTRRREQRKTKKKQHLSSFSGVLPLSLISKLKRLTTKPSSRPHRPKRSDPPKPVSCSSSPTAGTTPSPYGHRYSAHRPPSSPVDDVLHRIASRFPPSEGDERLIVRSRTSHPTQLISLTDLELRPIRCRRSGFPLAGSSPETQSVLKIPSEIERSGVDHRLRQWNRRRRRPNNGSETSPRRPSGDRKLKKPATEEETEGSLDPMIRSPPARLPKPIETTGLDLPRRLIHGQDPVRKSIAGKIRSRARVRVYSPRAEMGRSKASAARVRGKGGEKVRRELESFAVLKCSQDPQGDFRESIMEMITEKGMRQAAELEELLACYLYLNSVEHHDVIVRVFRQVWLDLIRERFGSESESELGAGFSPASETQAR